MEIATLRRLIAHGKTRRPELASRLDRAASIVVTRDMDHGLDNTWSVESLSQPGHFHTVAERCDCADASRAPGEWCSHRLAVGLVERARELEHTRAVNLDRSAIAYATARRVA